MMDKYQFVTAVLAILGTGSLAALPALATDDIHSSLLGALMDGRTIDPRAVQIADTVQSTSSAGSASVSSSSSVTVTGGKKQGECVAEAAANAKAGDAKDSDHDLKVSEGDGCSAKAESSAVVKPKKQQAE